LKHYPELLDQGTEIIWCQAKKNFSQHARGKLVCARSSFDDCAGSFFAAASVDALKS
jgi:hypothetical protein